MKYIILLIIALLVPFSSVAATLEGQSDNIPWSGYWWPINEGELVSGYKSEPSPSPFEKFDLINYGFFPSALTNFGNNPANGIYNSSAPSWWGFCHAWANAAVSEPVNFESSVVNGTFLSIGDKKGLLTLIHRDDVQLHAVCNSSPLVFHQFLLEYIGENHFAIASDLDCTEEVWSHPIYSYVMNIEEETNQDIVSCTINYASDFVTPDYNGTLSSSQTYTYVLTKNNDGDYIGSEWTGESINEHPETVWLPVEQNFSDDVITYDEVKTLVLSTGDGCNGTIKVGPNLIVVGYSQKNIPLERYNNSTLKLSLVLDPQNSADSQLVSLQVNGSESEVLSISDDLVTLNLNSNNDYNLIVNSNNSTTSYIRVYYQVDYEHTYFYECLPANYEWVGLALSSLNPNQNNSVLCSYVFDNQIESYNFLDKTINTNSSVSVVAPTNTFYDYFFDSRSLGIKVTSTHEIDPTILKGLSVSMCGPSIKSTESTKFIIPTLTSTGNFYNTSNMFVVNENSKNVLYNTEYITQTASYSSDGNILETSINLYNPGHYPTDMNLSGWGIIETSDNSLISGAIVNEHYQSGVYQLPFLTLNNSYYLPHYVNDDLWDTDVVIYNSNNEMITISCNIFYGDGDSLYKELDVEAKTRINLRNVEGFFDDDISWIRFDSVSNFTGYLIFNTLNTLTTLPLIDSTYQAKTLRLGHVASNFEWWTGIGLLNTESSASEVTIFAYDENGFLLNSQIINVEASSKYVNTISNLFQNDFNDIANIFIYSDNSIIGFVLYGDKFDRKYLSGRFLNEFN